jgi:hypothetical protein
LPYRDTLPHVGELEMADDEDQEPGGEELVEPGPVADAAPDLEEGVALDPDETYRASGAVPDRRLPGLGTIDGDHPESCVGTRAFDSCRARGGRWRFDGPSMRVARPKPGYKV